jgi:hypothetical protein
MSFYRDSYVTAEGLLCKFRPSRKRKPIKHTNIGDHIQYLLIPIILAKTYASWQPFLKVEAKLSGGSKILKKRGGSHVNANSFSHSGCIFFRLIYSTYFILKKKCCKVCVCVSLSKSATEVVCLLIFQVNSLRSTVQF